jgi:hypothetical protein
MTSDDKDGVDDLPTVILSLPLVMASERTSQRLGGVDFFFC